MVPVTGGRDSRLVLGAALAAGIDFETTTGGEPGHPDVEIGRQLARVAGVPWRILEHDPHGSVTSDWRRAAELLSLTTSGTSSLSDAAGFPFGPRPARPSCGTAARAARSRAPTTAWAATSRWTSSTAPSSAAIPGAWRSSAPKVSGSSAGRSRPS